MVCTFDSAVVIEGNRADKMATESNVLLGSAKPVVVLVMSDSKLQSKVSSNLAG
jgi:hypothetical protein